MVACLAKNRRGRPLFEALSTLNPQYRYLGETRERREALAFGALQSISFDLARVKREARFSPFYLDDQARQCASMVDQAGRDVSAALYWGATNAPIDSDRQRVPYFLITDGPFDPSDASYPVEWRPERWKASYFEAQRRVFKNAAHVFTLSEWARVKLLSVHNLDPSRISKCGWGPIGSIGGPRLAVPSGKTLFLSVGSEWKRKGMDVVAEAGGKLFAENGDCETMIVGSPVDLELKARPGVSLLPHALPSTMAHSLMRDASALLVASRFDASPHVIYESMQYGTPVIGTRTCGVPEAILEGGSGLLIETAEPEELLNAMRRFMSLDQGALRRGAFQSFVESGGWPAVAKHIDDVITAYLTN